ERLRALLAEELGIDPSPETRELHQLTLREEEVPSHDTAAKPSHEIAAKPSRLAGRDRELDRLTTLWTDAANGQPALVLVAGEAGIGKTTLSRALVDIVTGVGGQVLSARCYEAERSLFLQPVADALGQHAARQSPTTLERLVGDGVAPLTQLV